MPEAAITTYSRDAQKMYERGIAAARGGQRRVAAGLLTRAVQLDPRHEQAWLWLSGVLDDPKDIAFCLHSALKLNPNNVQAQKGLAWIQQRHAISAAQGTTGSLGASAASQGAPAAEARPTSRLQQIEIPPAGADRAAKDAPQTWWQEWRSSQHAHRILRVSALVGLIVLLLATSAMLYLAPTVPANAALTSASVPTPAPDSVGAAQQTILTAPEVNQAAVLHYLSDVGEVRERIKVAAENYRKVSDISTIAPDQIAAARTYRDVLRQSYTDLERITPPAVLNPVHAEYKQGVQLEQAAFEDVLEYYTNYNVAIANRAALRLQEAGGHYDRALSGWSAYQQQLSAPGLGPAFGER